MYIGVLPYEMRNAVPLSEVSLNDLLWPLGAPDLSGQVKDLAIDDHVVVYPSSKRILRSLGKLSCKVGLLLAEPRAVHNKYYRMAGLLQFKFDYVLCRDPRLADNYNRVYEFNVAESWVKPEQVVGVADSHVNLCSLIASNKRDLAGHQLRHQVVQSVANQGLDIKVLGRGYQPFDEKWQGLLPYKFSVIIENIQEHHYFTEKLLDAFMCETVPIYWGAPNISEYFDTKGMFICSSHDEIMQTLTVLNNETYEAMRESIKANYHLALAYQNLPKRIALAVAKQFEVKQ